MKKFAIGAVAAVAAVIAATSFAGPADAGWRWKHRHGWHHRHHVGVVVGSRVWIGPRVVVASGCVVKKKVNRYGEVVRKRFC